MVENQLLKKIGFLKDLPNEILKKVGAIALLETFEKESILFKQNQEKTHLYMLVSGKIFLDCGLASGKSLTLDEVSAGRTVGVSSLLGVYPSAFTAICAEPSTIITVSGQDMRQLFLEDFETGHAVMLKVVEIFRSRMRMHTRQFLHSMLNHHEIIKLESNN
ncbi:MAG: family transcriptional regulator, cyclic receptor protein [Thermodesulfobacteriota bacterium]|nr:family transcriptional regulator, cyclic receptor protein [Thermodesulfobacteriota bacterium]